MAVVEGCFNGLTSTILAFGLKSDQTDSERKSQLYDALLKCCVRPEDSVRRTAYRAALELFVHHAMLFMDRFLDPSDAQHW